MLYYFYHFHVKFFHFDEGNSKINYTTCEVTTRVNYRSVELFRCWTILMKCRIEYIFDIIQGLILRMIFHTYQSLSYCLSIHPYVLLCLSLNFKVAFVNYERIVTLRSKHYLLYLCLVIFLYSIFKIIYSSVLFFILFSSHFHVIHMSAIYVVELVEIRLFQFV